MSDHEETLFALVRAALERLEAGDELDLDTLCAEHPELRSDVEQALGLRSGLASLGEAATSGDRWIGRELGPEGRYVLTECLGRGAMGVVYAAHDRELERTVAVKIFLTPGGTAPTKEEAERFRREATTLASLDDEHVVGVFDRGTSATGELFLVMEHLSGRPLSDVLAVATEAFSEGGTSVGSTAPWTELFPERSAPRGTYLHTVTTWIAEVAGGLRAAHDTGVIHRDVKPSNIFIRDDLSAVLIDFGIAARAGDAALTMTQTSLGTPWYMAPEQVRGTGRDDPRVDVYATCATLYHLIARRPPYEGPAATVFAAIQSEDPPRIQSLHPNLPRDLAAIIEHGMERDPARRYPNMAALERDLRAFLAHQPVSARPLTPLGRLTRKARRRPALAFAIVASTVLLPVAIALTMAARELAEQEAVKEFGAIVRSLPRQLSIEGNHSQRRGFNADVRQRTIDQLTRLLELRPAAREYRAHLAAHLEDAGRPGRAATEWARLAGEFDDPFLAALAAPLSATRQVADLELDDLPRPKTPVGCFAAALVTLRARGKDWAKAAWELLEVPAADARSPAFVDLRIVTLAGLNETTRDPELLNLAFAEATAIEGQRGFETATTLGTRGYVLLSQRRDYEAIVLLERASALCPDQFDVHQNLAIAHQRLADLDAMTSHLNEALRIRPDSWRTRHALARAAKDRGEFDTARELAQALEIEDPGRRWMQEDILSTINRAQAARILGGVIDEESRARAKPYAEAAVRHAEAAVALAPSAGVGEIIEIRKRIAAAMAQEDYFAAVCEMLDEMRYKGHGVDDPYHLESFAMLVSLSEQIEPELRMRLSGMIRRLARKLAPNDPVFGKRQIDAISQGR